MHVNGQKFVAVDHNIADHFFSNINDTADKFIADFSMPPADPFISGGHNAVDLFVVGVKKDPAEQFVAGVYDCTADQFVSSVNQARDKFVACVSETAYSKCIRKTDNMIWHPGLSQR
jgi:hypothetical protein